MSTKIAYNSQATKASAILDRASGLVVFFAPFQP